MGSVEHTHPANPYSTGKTHPLRYKAKASHPSLTNFERIGHKISIFSPQT
jgi:hypothetical protein